MFATAIRQGEDEKTLSTVIGRHPEDGILVVLDEATDITSNIVQAIPNLKKGTSFFQVWAIGNSKSKNDTHGALSTPKNGWDSIDPMRDSVWETTQENGICLYFNPYKSPAITHPDPVKRERLGKFLITQEEIDQDKEKRGEHSDGFYRFTLGFWKKSNIDNTLASEQFLNEHQIQTSTEWSGLYPMDIVGGLDPAFASGGDGCILRLAILGHNTAGQVVLDYRNTELLFKIEINVTTDESSEYQLAKQICKILADHNCPVQNIAIDATGAGRALGELIRLISGQQIGPAKIISTAGAAQGMKGFQKNSKDPSIHVATPTILWTKFREFIQFSQIKGLDNTTTAQLTNRLLKEKNGKMILESKKDFKSRMNAISPILAHSPDEADAAILALHSAILRFGFSPGQKRALPPPGQNKMMTQKLQALQQERAIQRDAFRTETIERAPLIANFSDALEDHLDQDY